MKLNEYRPRRKTDKILLSITRNADLLVKLTETKNKTTINIQKQNEKTKRNCLL